MGKKKKYWKGTGIRIRTKLMLLMILTISLILGITSVLMYRNNEKTVETQALYSFEENAQKTCDILDTRLAVVKEATEKLNLETRLFDIFYHLDTENPYMLLQASDQISTILRDYIPWYSDIYSIHLVTSYYRFGDESENYYPSFGNSNIYKMVHKANGKMVWFPTYSYTEMFGITNLQDNQIPYGKLFSAARLMNLSDVSSGKVKRLSDYAENPVLIVNFQPDYMEEVLVKHGTNDSLEDTQYYVISEEGGTVYSTDEQYPAGGIYQAGWLDKLEEGTDFDGFFIEEEKQRYLLSYSRSEITDWLVVMKIPVTSLTGTMKTQFMNYLLIAFLTLMLLSVFLAWILSSHISGYFYCVIGMIDKISEGDFEQKLIYNEKDEFSFFYRKLEKMNDDIRDLIHENYEVKLMQRETEIKTLNAQLNPHFLYNTLNAINWTCLEGKAEETSKMLVNLSRMLQYTAYHKNACEYLKDDIEWLKRYLYIMKIRFEEKFDVVIRIPETLLDMEVPKLFLQPFVENAIVHGFVNMEEKGMLEIYTEMDKNDVLFYVEDNGCGMSQEKIREILKDSPDSVGMANVDQRIKMLYGKKYGVECYSQPGEGTCIMVRIPAHQDK